MSKQSAVLLILIGGSCMSFVGFFMRLIETADGFQILFFRSLALTVIVGAVACIRLGLPPLKALRTLDRYDLAMGLALSLAFATYIFSMLLTSVASTLFILTVTPFLAAVFGWFWLGERPHNFAWVAMIAAGFGVSLMISDGIALGRTTGNLLAFISAILFAIMLVIARSSGKQTVLGGTFLGGVFSTLIGLFAAVIIGKGLAASNHDILVALFMGAFTIGLGIALVTTGTPFVPAAEVSLLVLIESVLGPVWVWVFIGEAMTQPEIIGGLIVLVSVVGMTIVSARGTQTVSSSNHPI
jgi:DME family drug/metabolite transporter